MTQEDRPAHSPLGASGAERWMNCPGSVALLKAVALPESDEPDYRRDGTCAHEAAAHCLKNVLDAWEVAGMKFHDTEVTPEIAEAVQVYLNEARAIAAGAEEFLPFIEYGISSPIHKDFYGTIDLAFVFPKLKKLVIRDYKHGAGIIVEVEENPQIMYYAYGILREFPDIETVDLGIVQPRGFHPEGPIRTWTVSADYIRGWAEKTLLPAMLRTELDDTLDAGPWCRFCPAKLVCPLLTSLFGAACTANPKVLPNLSDKSFGLSYQYLQAVEFYAKAYKAEALRRLQKGSLISGIKLVYQKANRVWKEGADAVMRGKFGEDVMTAPEFKSPAEMEKIGPDAKTLVREWAYTPQNGLTVALETDKRPAVKVQSVAEAFPDAAEAVDRGARHSGNDHGQPEDVLP